jgi:uncharacterized membrane protein YdjX (TVP38/TMEM64 family)
VSERARQGLRALLVLLALAALLLLLRQLNALTLLARGAEQARAAGPLGVVAVALAYVAGALLLLPMVPLALAVGFIYGMPGALITVPMTALSAAIPFLAGRALAELAERGGLITVALLRVSPILPFTPSNFVLGMTAVRLRDLVLGTLIGVTPGSLLYTSAGALLPDAAALERGEAPRGPFWAILVLGVLAMGIIGTAAARKLRQVSRAAPK